MYITSINLFSTGNVNSVKSSKVKFSYQQNCDTVTFTGMNPEMAKPIKEAFLDKNITPQKVDALFKTLPIEYQERINAIAEALKGYDVDRNRLFKKFVFQPCMLTSKPEMIISRIKAHAFVERHKNGHPIEEIIPYVVDSKNLGKSIDSIFMPILISKAFATQGHRPSCFVDESGLENTFKRYCRRNPDVVFDKIEILDDEMSKAFIDFTKRLSKEIKGHENLFDVSIKSEVKPDIVPKQLDNENANTVKDTLKKLKYHAFETGDKSEILRFYAALPDRYHYNFSALFAELKRNRVKLDMYELLNFYLRNPAFFNMELDEAVNLIKVKQFIDKNSGKNNISLIETIKKGFFPSSKQNVLFSHFLVSKMFPEKSKMPWYLKGANNADFTDYIKIFLRENPQYRLEVDVMDAEKASDFCNYAEALSSEAIGRNAFKINVVE